MDIVKLRLYQIKALHPTIKTAYTVFPHIRPVGIIILHSLQMRVLLENTTFPLHKIVRIAGIIRGRALYEEIRYCKISHVVVLVQCTWLDLKRVILHEH